MDANTRGRQLGSQFTMTVANRLQICSVGWELFLKAVEKKELTQSDAEAFGTAFLQAASDSSGANVAP